MTGDDRIRADLERIAAAARWYVACTVDGARRDCAWFELESAVKAHYGEENAHALAAVHPADDGSSRG